MNARTCSRPATGAPCRGRSLRAYSGGCSAGSCSPSSARRPRSPRSWGAACSACAATPGCTWRADWPSPGAGCSSAAPPMACGGGCGCAPANGCWRTETAGASRRQRVACASRADHSARPASGSDRSRRAGVLKRRELVHMRRAAASRHKGALPSSRSLAPATRRKGAARWCHAAARNRGVQSRVGCGSAGCPPACGSPRSACSSPAGFVQRAGGGAGPRE